MNFEVKIFLFTIISTFNRILNSQWQLNEVCLHKIIYYFLQLELFVVKAYMALTDRGSILNDVSDAFARK